MWVCFLILGVYCFIQHFTNPEKPKPQTLNPFQFRASGFRRLTHMGFRERQQHRLDEFHQTVNASRAL